MSLRLRGVSGWLMDVARPSLAAAGAVVLFLFAVQLLGASTEAATPLLRRWLLPLLDHELAALGLGWLGAYVLANGSVVAALALSLFTADLVTAGELFQLVVGSRLGAAAVVVFIGAVDYLHDDRRFVESVSMGLLTFLLTLSVYLPVAAIGAVGWPRLPSGAVVGLELAPGAAQVGLFDAAARTVTSTVGAGPSVLVAVAVLFGSLKLFDRVLAAVDTRTLRTRLFNHLRRTWLSFGLGLVVTGLTTSVAFSLGVIVPLYNRGYVKRDELIPYVLGANIGTLLDTLVVAVVLGTPTGTGVVVLTLALAGGVTLLALLAGDRYTRLVADVDDRLLEDRTAFVAFVAALALVPLGFVGLALGVG